MEKAARQNAGGKGSNGQNASEVHDFPSSSSLSRRTFSLTSNVRELTTNVGALSRNVDELTSDVDALSANVDAKTGDVDALKFNVETLKFNVFALKFDVLGKSKSLNALFINSLRIKPPFSPISRKIEQQLFRLHPCSSVSICAALSQN